MSKFNAFPDALFSEKFTICFDDLTLIVDYQDIIITVICDDFWSIRKNDNNGRNVSYSDSDGDWTTTEYLSDGKVLKTSNYNPEGWFE